MKTVACAVSLLVFCSACAETLVIRSTPPGAQVLLNGQPSGITPTEYSTRNVEPLTYRIEKEGFPPAEGIVETPIAPGRLVGTIFTLGILAACRPLRYFTPNPLDVQLGQTGTVAGIASLRLWNLKNATVLEGQCSQQRGICSVTLPSGETCSGDYIRDPTGTTTISATSRSGSGYGVGFVPGAGVGTVGVQTQNAVVAGGKEVANVTQGVAVLRCQQSIIDCTLTLDAFGLQGHGDCKDTQGQTYRATLFPQTQ